MKITELGTGRLASANDVANQTTREDFAVRLLVVIFALGMALGFAAPVSGQQATAAKEGVADDWSHHRLVFSSPGTAEDAIRNGWYGRWLEIENDLRYQLQERKRSFRAMGAPGSVWNGFGSAPDANAEGDAGEGERESLGAVDPVDLNHLPRGLVKAPLVRREEWRFEREARPGSLRVHTDWSENMGSGATAGLGVYPAKFSFTTTSANCAVAATPDYVVYNTGLAGSGTQASIIAYDNLYTGGCTSGAVPSVYWAYNTNGGTVATSVVLSLDGSQVAFAQTTGGVASLVVLKWAASASLDSLASTAAGSYRGCGAPCMTSLTFSGSANDSGSSAFVDYGSDTLYIGDDSGKLHKFTGVFRGTPTEAGSPWPVTVGPSALNGPVYDSGSGNIFVGDYLLNESSTCAPSGSPCGYFHSVNASSGAVVTSKRLDFIFGIVESAVVDSAAGMAYVFVGADGESGAASACGSDIPCSGVFQFPVNFANGSGGTEAPVGPGYSFLLAGAFDDAYLTSGTPASPSGHMYVVGNTGAANNTLYQVSISSNVMNSAPVAGPAVSENYTNGYMAAGLGVTEFDNGGHDYIFLSVLSFGAPAACSATLANGCVMGFDVTGGTISAGTTPTAATTEAGGTSSIIIDNSAALAGASNIYFTPLANQFCTTSGTIGGCAIQTLQAAP